MNSAKKQEVKSFVMIAKTAVLMLLLSAKPIVADSLSTIKHVVIFMQENRFWDSVSVCFRKWLG